MNSNKDAFPDHEDRRELRALGWWGKHTIYGRRARRPKTPRPVLPVGDDVPVADLKDYE